MKQEAKLAAIHHLIAQLSTRQGTVALDSQITTVVLTLHASELEPIVKSLESALEALENTPIPRVSSVITETEIDDFLSDYEMIGEDSQGRDCSYTPTDTERYIIKDAMMGLLAMHEDSVPAESSPAPTLLTKAGVEFFAEAFQEFAKTHPTLWRNLVSEALKPAPATGETIHSILGLEPSR